MLDNYNLKGLSKDEVKIIYDNGFKKEKIFVRKIAVNKSNASRLKDQYQLIKNWTDDLIKVPKLINQGFTKNNDYFFDMEFINGPSLAHMIFNPTKNNINFSQKAIKIIKDYFLRNISSQNLPDKIQLMFYIKNKLNLLISFFNKLDNKYIRKELMDDVKKYSSFIEHSNILSDKIQTKKYKYKTHGDLTLSNVLMANNNLYFIDFNTHFLGSSIIADISKFFFDLDFCLSLKLESGSLEIDISTLNFLNNVKNDFYIAIEKNLSYLNLYKEILLAIESLRVLQYVYDNNIELSNNLQLYAIKNTRISLKNNFICQL